MSDGDRKIVGLFDRVKLSLLSSLSIGCKDEYGLLGTEVNPKIFGAKYRRIKGYSYLVVDVGSSDVRTDVEDPQSLFLNLRDQERVFTMWSVNPVYKDTTMGLVRDSGLSCSVRIRFSNNRLIIKYFTSANELIESAGLMRLKGAGGVDLTIALFGDRPELLFKSTHKPYYRYFKVCNYSDKSPYMRVTRARMLASMISHTKYKFESGKWVEYRNKCFRHWPIKKKGKPGYRLISAPKVKYRAHMREFKDILDCFRPSLEGDSGGDIKPVTLSYLKGVDHVKALFKEELSTDKVGSRCMELDYSDFFTRITPELLSTSLVKMRWWVNAEALGSIEGKYPDMFDFTANYTRRGEELSFMLEVMVTFAVMYLMDIVPFSLAYLQNIAFKADTSRAKYASILATLVTTGLPLWKIDVAGKDILSEKNGQDEHGYNKYVKKVRDPFDTTDMQSTIYDYHAKYGIRPWSVKGVPQGAPYSGNLANFVALYLAGEVTKEVSGVLKDFGGKVNKVIVYSDNLYLFYDAKRSNQEIFKRELPKVVEAVMGAKRGLLKSKKIFCINRVDKDVKILGLILDGNGHLRLSRKMRRKVNQIIIKDSRGKPMGQSGFGKLKWYERVRVVAGDSDYKKGLITLGAGIASNTRVLTPE